MGQFTSPPQEARGRLILPGGEFKTTPSGGGAFIFTQLYPLPVAFNLYLFRGDI